MNTRLYQQDLFRQAAGDEFRPGGLPLTRSLALACGLRPGERVLDLGCGVGSTAAHLSREWGAVVTGLDASPGFVVEARGRHPQVNWVLGRAEAIPFLDAEFDVVFAECFLSTVDASTVLGEIRRVLKPGGRLALSDVYLRGSEAHALSAVAAAACLGGAVTSEVTLNLLHRSGFAVTLWEDRSEVLKALMASLIFAYGSVADFWKASLGERSSDADIEHLREQLDLARPGYYIVVAEAIPPTPAPPR